MKYNPHIHHRRSIRLKGYDYSRPGAYFITICTHQRECLLGEIIDGQIQLNQFGKIVQYHWQNLEKHHSHIQLDEFVVMPNHFHGIIIINTKLDTDTSINIQQTAIPEIIRGFKTFSARQINKLRHQPGVPLWQRNYYERIIRDEEELNQIKKYIINNPQNWEKDLEANGCISVLQKKKTSAKIKGVVNHFDRMTPEQETAIQSHIQSIAEILYENTSAEELETLLWNRDSDSHTHARYCRALPCPFLIRSRTETTKGRQ